MRRVLRLSFAVGLILPFVISHAIAREPYDNLTRRAHAMIPAVVARLEQRIRTEAAKLTGEDQDAARKAIRYFTEIGEPMMVSLALEYPADSIQVEAAKSLEECGNREALPPMLAALKTAIGPVFGGTETQLRRREIRRTLIKGIARITSLDLKAVDPDSEESVAEAIRTVESWLKKEGRTEDRK